MRLTSHVGIGAKSVFGGLSTKWASPSNFPFQDESCRRPECDDAEHRQLCLKPVICAMAHGWLPSGEPKASFGYKTTVRMVRCGEEIQSRSTHQQCRTLVVLRNEHQVRCLVFDTQLSAALSGPRSVVEAEPTKGPMNVENLTDWG